MTVLYFLPVSVPNVAGDGQVTTGASSSKKRHYGLENAFNFLEEMILYFFGHSRALGFSISKHMETQMMWVISSH